MDNDTPGTYIELQEWLSLSFPPVHPATRRTLYILYSFASGMLGGKPVHCAGFLAGTSLTIDADWHINHQPAAAFEEWDAVEADLPEWVPLPRDSVGGCTPEPS